MAATISIPHWFDYDSVTRRTSSSPTHISIPHWFDYDAA